VEPEIGEPPVRVTSAPFRQHARRPPRGSRRAELMMTCLATRPHWLLASLFRFQGATTRHRNLRATHEGSRSRSESAEPTLTSASTTPARGGVGRSVRVNPTRKWFSGRTGDTTGCLDDLQLVTANFCARR
jgi:hypothetical protein